jgi:hypothetical protein
MFKHIPGFTCKVDNLSAAALLSFLKQKATHTDGLLFQITVVRENS